MAKKKQKQKRRKYTRRVTVWLRHRYGDLRSPNPVKLNEVTKVTSDLCSVTIKQKNGDENIFERWNVLRMLDEKRVPIGGR